VSNARSDWKKRAQPAVLRLRLMIKGGGEAVDRHMLPLAGPHLLMWAPPSCQYPLLLVVHAGSMAWHGMVLIAAPAPSKLGWLGPCVGGGVEPRVF
jgi:hypothetical protein